MKRVIFLLVFTAISCTFQVHAQDCNCETIKYLNPEITQSGFKSNEKVSLKIVYLGKTAKDLKEIANEMPFRIILQKYGVSPDQAKKGKEIFEFYVKPSTVRLLDNGYIAELEIEIPQAAIGNFQFWTVPSTQNEPSQPTQIFTITQ